MLPQAPFDRVRVRRARQIRDPVGQPAGAHALDQVVEIAGVGHVAPAGLVRHRAEARPDPCLQVGVLEE